MEGTEDGRRRKSRIAVIRCPDFVPAAVERGLRQSLACGGGLGGSVKPGGRVLSKVNLLSPKAPEKTLTTHLAAVAGMARRQGETGQ